MPETPQGQPESMVFAGFSGLKNTLDRERLGPRDLAVAVNIDLDDAGQPHRRRGRRKVASGKFHSLFQASNGDVYGVKDGNLGIVEPDYFFLDLGRSVGDSPLAYEQVRNELFFSSPNSQGIINTATGDISDWGPAENIWLSPVVNTSDTLPAVRGKILGAPPFATALAYYNGRIYMASGNMLWATEFQNYRMVDKNRGFIQFEDDITMVAAVSNGLYIGTTAMVYFLEGGSFETLKKQSVMSSGVIPGSACYMPAELANPPQVGPNADEPLAVSVAFMTTNGFNVGQESGKCLNLTEASVFFPQAVRASAMFRRLDGMNHYVVCLKSSGAPVNSARSGEYVDPSIIRGKDMWVDMSDTAIATERVS